MNKPFFLKASLIIALALLIVFIFWFIGNRYEKGIDNIESKYPDNNPTQAQRNFLTERNEYCMANPGKCKGFDK